METKSSKITLFFKIILGFLLLMILALSVSHHIVRLGFVYFLEQQGAHLIKVGEIDLNYLKGIVKIKNLHIGKKNDAHIFFNELFVDIAATQSSINNIVIERIFLDNASVRLIHQANDVISLGFPLPINKPSSDTDITNTKTEPNDLKVVIKQLEVIDSTFTAKSIPLNFDVKITFDINQSIQLHTKPNGIVSFLSSGNVVVNNMDLEIPVPKLDTLKLSNTTVSWQGNIDLTIPANKSDPMLKVAGEIDNQQLKLMLLDHQTSISYQRLSWKGSIENLNEIMANEFDLRGEVLLQDFSIKQTNKAFSVIDFDELVILEIAVDGLNKLMLDGVQLKNLNVAKEIDRDIIKNKTLFSLKELDIDMLSLTELNALHIKKIKLLESATAIHLNAQGSDAMIRSLIDFSNAFSNTNNQTSGLEQGESKQVKITKQQLIQTNITDQSEFTFTIQEVITKGDQLLYFQDQRVSPPFKIDLVFEKVHLANIDKTKPKVPLSIEILAKEDNYNKIHGLGHIHPFTEQLSADIKLNIDALDTKVLSSYVATATGYNVENGQLDAVVDFKILENQFDSNLDLNFLQLKLTPNDPNKIIQLTKSLTIPLDYALNMIRDRNGNISISIPVTGDINNPDLNLNDLLEIAVGKALKLASVSYIKNILAPYGQMIAIGQYTLKAGKKLTQIKLDPVLFESNTDQLDQNTKRYMSVIAKLLKEKQKLNLKVCGKALDNELEDQQVNLDQTQTMLLQLAKKRSENVKQQIVNQGTDPKRIFVCAPEIIRAVKGNKPVVHQLLF